MRAFVAVDLPSNGPTGPAEPAPSAPPHFTVLFLGEVPDARVARFAQALSTRVRSLPPFALALGDVGAFPSNDRPRVVFRRVSVGAESLERLASVSRAVAASEGLPFDGRPFVPHLTILRVRRPQDEGRARRLLEEPPTEGEPWMVNEVLVKESRLGPSGPVHRVVQRCPLVGAGVPG